jgi:hypothetical protein
MARVMENANNPKDDSMSTNEDAGQNNPCASRQAKMEQAPIKIWHRAKKGATLP